ncbi:hypothetical protein [Sulfitobacter sp. CW3]|uniref:hypothetical protein n=1 Tax=Sulfitobacter sp. CW3 TaxID=2861965 RepID=UPI001C5E874C|nr:hypothetical protein [Sulfitobacter sp. CW3]MBW4963856.1 hypothetical protein [Sulfitobacter sp. CW3]
MINSIHRLITICILGLPVPAMADVPYSQVFSDWDVVTIEHPLPGPSRDVMMQSASAQNRIYAALATADDLRSSSMYVGVGSVVATSLDIDDLMADFSAGRNAMDTAAITPQSVGTGFDANAILADIRSETLTSPVIMINKGFGEQIAREQSAAVFHRRPNDPVNGAIGSLIQFADIRNETLTDMVWQVGGVEPLGAEEQLLSWQGWN